jgi:hypothetical protein
LVDSSDVDGGEDRTLLTGGAARSKSMRRKTNGRTQLAA